MIKINLLNYARESLYWIHEDGEKEIRPHNWLWKKRTPNDRYRSHRDILKFSNINNELYISEYVDGERWPYCWKPFAPFGENVLTWSPLPIRIDGHPVKVVDGEFVTDREREALFMEKGLIE